MRKFIASFVLPFVFASPAFAQVIVVSGGSVDCSTGIFTDNTTLVTSPATAEQKVGCGGNGDPGLVMQAWGLTGHESKHLIVPAGTVISDEAGITSECPAFIYWGCVNLTGLDYWKNQARKIAQQTNGYGKFSYWLTH